MITIEHLTREQCYERAIELIHKLRPAGCFGDEEGHYGLLEAYVMALENPPSAPSTEVRGKASPEMEQLMGRLRKSAKAATLEIAPRRVVKVGDPRNPGEQILAAMNIMGRRPTQYVVHTPKSGIHCSADADFVAAASPENILKLLDHIEGKG